MNEESRETVDQNWFDSVRTDYYHQMKTINDIVLKARVLLSFLAAAIVPVFVVIQGVESPIEVREGFSLTIALGILIYGSVPAYYLCRSFLGVKYKQIPPLDPLKQCSQDNAQLVRWLDQHYRECADFNRIRNKRRMKAMDKGANHLFVTVFLMLVLVFQSEILRFVDDPMPDQPETSNPTPEDASEHQEPTSNTEKPDAQTDSSPFENDEFTRSED